MLEALWMLILVQAAEPIQPDSAAASGIVTATESEDRYSTLDSLLAKREYSKIRGLLQNVSSREIFDKDLMWLQRQSMSGHTAFSNLMYGQNLWAMVSQSTDPRVDQVKQTAAAQIAYTLWVLDIDGARCSDRSAPADRSLKIMTASYPILEWARNSDPESKSLIVKVILLLDDKMKERRVADFDSAFLCTGGLQHMAYGLKNGSTTEREPKEGEFGRQVVIDDGGDYVPGLIELEEWRKISEEKRAKRSNWINQLLAIKPE